MSCWGVSTKRSAHYTEMIQMIGRILLVLMCGVAGWAQLPPPQAPPPRIEFEEVRGRRKEPEAPKHEARLDAVVYDRQGEPVTGLKAGDFFLTVEGNPQKIDTCTYRSGQPLRLVVVLDDLSLSPEHNNETRRELRALVDRLRPEDQMAVLRASAGSGAVDRLTSDHAELQAAIDRAAYDPAAETALPETLAGTLRWVVRTALDGMSELPGRKALLFISERLREPGRNTHVVAARFGSAAHRAAAVLYAVDVGTEGSSVTLDLGLSEEARKTGGLFFSRGSVAEALARIAADQSGYYLLTYRAQNVGYDYLAGTPHIDQVRLTTPARESVIRARNGVFSGAEDDDTDFDDMDRSLARVVETELAAGAVGAQVTAVVQNTGSWQLSAMVHLNAMDLTFVRGADGKYRSHLETIVELAPDSGMAPDERLPRTIDLTMSEKGLREFQAQGIDFTGVLRLPRPGAYSVRVVARDAATGKTGTARTRVAADWGPAKLSMSSLVIHGDVVKNANGEETLVEPSESSSVRSFRSGHRLTYVYDLVNVGSDAEKRSLVEVRARIWRDGTIITDGAPMPVRFEPSEAPTRRGATGTLTLRAQTRPGRYVLGLTVTDKISGRSATQFIDFEVRP
jgi:VWFA-related protein